MAGGSTRSGQSYSVNGMRPESNQFLVDGVENYNSINAGFVLKPPPDAIAEFRILTNTASAEFGHNAGSNTNIVMRSGSNRFTAMSTNSCETMRWMPATSFPPTWSR